jgi:hypothetical protein
VENARKEWREEGREEGREKGADMVFGISFVMDLFSKRRCMGGGGKKRRRAKRRGRMLGGVNKGHGRCVGLDVMN